VRLGSTFSLLSKISVDVPHTPTGGIFSPFLFNIYIADQPSTNNIFQADHSDDKTIMSINTDSNQTSHVLQLHFHNFESWYTNWRIQINENKTVHITFALKRNNTPPVYLNNIQILVKMQND